MKLLKFIVLIVLCWSCKKAMTPANKEEEALLKSLSSKRVKLPNGWSLTPVGRSLPLNDLPLNLIVSPSHKYLAVSNNGQSTQSITLIDAVTEKVLDDVSIPKSYLGLAFSDDEKTLYASAGNDNKIIVYSIENQKLVQKSEIVLGKPWPNKISPVGLCVDSERQLLYVVTKDDRSLYICDLKTNAVSKKVDLTNEAYTCMLSPNRKTLYISMWGGAKVAFFDTALQTLSGEVLTDKNPNDLTLTKDGKYLFVSHGNDNTVSVIETNTRQKIESLSASIYPDSPIGTTPNGVALNEDETKLYIANADNNCLAVFDISEKGKSRSLGFIPTGWYPTAVKLVGKKVFVCNGKGFSSMANPDGPNPVGRKAAQQKGPNPEANKGKQYIAGLFKGTLSIFEEPDAKILGVYSQLVYENSPYSKARELTAEGEKGNPIPTKVGESSPIKYVFYIIKENRTYDQVLGDIKGGNGDPSLCLFPEKNTPNLHKIAKEFVLLDNFYADAEVSADGHNWSTAAYANDYVEKTWVSSYGGRGGTYDYEGGGREIAYPKNGFIWNYCQRAKISYRTYGEFSDHKKASLPVLEKHFCRDFPGFDMNIKDVDRVAIWEQDFDSLARANAIPKFNTIRLGNDHTSGARLNAPTPEAAVADNDLAVGKFIEHLSKSKIWAESAVFIIEDDAQNGPDHIDAHRTTAYVAGGFVKRGFIDHTMYSTSSMLRTIELILGLPPMSQYDAAAIPMYRCFMKKANTSPYTALASNFDLNAKNVAVNANSKKSALFDFTHEDAAPDIALNEVIWQVVKGPKSIMPAPKRSAFVKLKEKKKGEEDDDDDDDD
ncbi:40-residue YVTN family beta-propeller repeat-containing protein [Pseudarcicella hirudinis]|uniref:40-residue YVTN family beta-propeller repeat-containing protein n=1 Tax=Pseudarcicella hirudinis TaxID=1079859 RepID=A0A1I5UR47_9BACT|nr:beta-propeller fold lactonase family protein [Pseudarcicella hirudinis]SFP97741.1 40-residue YVTN family beta-propeller repeat-containing protein [Pseudarcicella hirudinis]